jgi:hypothetical protein
VKTKGIGWLALGLAVLLSSAPSAAAQEEYQPDIVYVCYWTGDYWLYASQRQYNADVLVQDGQALYPDEFGYCPTATPWDLGMDTTPMAGYCTWTTGLGYPGQGWHLAIAPVYLVAEWVADETDGTDVWLDWDGTCSDYPSAGAWYGEWSDELGNVHFPE